jgi:hypothetical protein
MSWTATGDTYEWVNCAVAVKPAGAGATPINAVVSDSAAAGLADGILGMRSYMALIGENLET